MKRWLKYLGITLVAVVMLLALAVLFVPYLGWQIDTVLSGSMSPTLKVGSLSFTQPVDPHSIELGDIITYRSPRNGKLTTHRVVGIVENNPLRFQTKGDANEDLDPYLVPSTNIEGKVAFNIPLMGYAADFVKTPLGFVLILGIPGLLIIVVEMRSMWIEMSKEASHSLPTAAGEQVRQ